MAFENKELSGALFKNENKIPGSKQPDFTGSIKIEGVDYRLAGWMTESRGGTQYVSLKATTPEQQEQFRSGEKGNPAADNFMSSHSSQTPERSARSGMTDQQFAAERQRMRDMGAQARRQTPTYEDDDIPF